MRGPFHRSPLVTGLAGSIALHAIAVVLLWVGDAPAEPVGAGASDLALVDIELLPTAEPRRVTTPPEPEPAVKPKPKPKPKPTAEVPRAVKRKRRPKPRPEKVAVTAPKADALPMPPAKATTHDEITTEGETDGEPSTEPAPAPEPEVTRQNIKLGLAALTELPPLENIFGGDQPPGVAADLNAAMPGNPVVTLVLRLDRLRDTMWAERTEAILAPMPDYRAMVRDGADSFFEHFDAMIISSPRPNDVTATLVATRIRGDVADARAFLDSENRISWKDTKLGARGARARASLPHPRDTRQFFLRADRWLLLARTEYFGKQTDWLDELDPTELLSGAGDDGPIALVTAGGLPATFTLPTIGDVPGPERITAALINAGHGFYIQGTLVFSDEARAETFAAALTAAKKSAVTGIAARSLLEGFGAYNAAKGLTFRQVGPAVSFATSVSILDARALCDLAAQWTAGFYTAKLEPEGI